MCENQLGYNYAYVFFANIYAYGWCFILRLRSAAPPTMKTDLVMNMIIHGWSKEDQPQAKGLTEWP